MYLCLRGACSTTLQRSEARPAAICFSAKFLSRACWTGAHDLLHLLFCASGLA